MERYPPGEQRVFRGSQSRRSLAPVIAQMHYIAAAGGGYSDFQRWLDFNNIPRGVYPDSRTAQPYIGSASHFPGVSTRFTPDYSGISADGARGMVPDVGGQRLGRTTDEPVQATGHDMDRRIPSIHSRSYKTGIPDSDYRYEQLERYQNALERHQTSSPSGSSVAPSSTTIQERSSQLSQSQRPGADRWIYQSTSEPEENDHDRAQASTSRLYEEAPPRPLPRPEFFRPTASANESKPSRRIRNGFRRSPAPSSQPSFAADTVKVEDRPNVLDRTSGPNGVEMLELSSDSEGNEEDGDQTMGESSTSNEGERMGNVQLLGGEGRLCPEQLLEEGPENEEDEEEEGQNGVLGRGPNPMKHMKIHPYIPARTIEKGKGRLLMKESEDDKEARRDKEWQILDQGDLGWEWTREGKKEASLSAKAKMPARDVAFFPYPDLFNLNHLKDVFAVIAGSQIKLYKLEDTPSIAGPNGTGRRLLLASHKSSLVEEEYYTCAWSVDTQFWPFDPVLAVAGTSGIIKVFRVRRNSLKIELKLERRLSGFGGIIYELKFSSRNPHFLAAACQDGAIYLLDPMIKGGSDAEVAVPIFQRIQEHKTKALPRGGANGQQQAYRPHVPGELRGMLLMHDEYVKPMVSVDIHPKESLIVGSGRDGRIFIWALPEVIFGVPWPSRTSSATPSLLLEVLPDIEPPLFVSSLVHPGHFADQVCFASAASAHVISRASRTRYSSTSESYNRLPQKELKLWVPHSLDKLPNLALGDHIYKSSLKPDSDRRIVAPMRGTLMKDIDSDGSRLISNSAFTIDKCYVSTDVNCNSFALYRPSHAPSPSAVSPNETFLAFSTCYDPALFILEPFALPQTCVESSLPGTSNCFFRPGDHIVTPAQDLCHVADEILPDHQEADEEYVPFGKASAICKELEDGDFLGLRSMAISPGGDWVAGVGDGGVICWWKRRMKKG